MTHRSLVSILPVAALALAGTLAAGPASAQPSIDVVTLPTSSPLVSIRLLFNAGSIYDPAGKEGLAALTALMLSEGATQKRSYGEMVDALYPMAAGIGANTDREVTSFTGTVHRDTLAAYTGLFQEALLQPAFAPADFERNRNLLVSFLANTLRSNDEMLSLEVLQDRIFAGHPYGHPPEGSVESLQKLTLDDVKAFYRAHYTQGSLMLGVAGGYPEGYPAELARAFAVLPAGTKDRLELPPLPKVTGRPFTLVDKGTGSVAIALGHPLPINRADPGYYPLLVANSYLGEHRTMYGRLMNQLRVLRGLNYGDYSYLEYWYYPPGTDYPTAGVPRRQQYFSIWVRPVAPGNAQFALRAALYELKRLHDQGMTKAEVETIRTLLLNYSKLWAQSPAERLGYLMDSKFYGMPPYVDEIEARLRKVTVEEVNAAIRKYLDPESWEAVIVTDNAAQLAETLRGDGPSPKTYNSQVPPQVLEEDKAIQVLPVKPAAITIVPVDQVFQK